ncbi:MAG TPA: TatD family hydrolase [Verrucomicrobiae bacterium]|nr:TatD family hydrolase [Verrucomicrobiae bacterium]
MGFIDTHAHLHFPDYDQDRADVMRRASEAGLETFINVGTDLESSRKCLELAKAHDNIYASAGVHPHDAKDADEAVIAEIRKLFSEKKMVAVGEVGLDFFRDHSPHEKQKEVLRAFVRLAREVGRPLIIHCRDAYEDLAQLFAEEGGAPYRGVIHCFSSDAPRMKRLLDLGFYISFAGPLTYKKNDELRDACRQCPKDRLLLETDAPFLPPQSVRGKRNEPAYMLETAGVAAGLHSLSVQALGEQTTANAKALFSL